MCMLIEFIICFHLVLAILNVYHISVDSLNMTARNTMGGFMFSFCVLTIVLRINRSFPLLVSKSLRKQPESTVFLA